MWHELELGREFFAALVAVDEDLVKEAAAKECRHCGGRLHRGDYDRKPRGGAIAAQGEEFVRRFGLCCGRRGCRRRVLPPSVRFLGRRVYLEAAILVVCAGTLLAGAARAAARTAQIPVRTMRRWSRWWRTVFPRTALWRAEHGRFPPPAPAVDRLPGSLLERFSPAGGDAATTLAGAAWWLRPLSTSSLRR